MPDFAPRMIITMVQQIITGVTPSALVCVPMFILSASIITSGESAGRLIRMLKVFVGHLPGGLPITTNASCTLFGAVSGSTQATVAAIGGTMRPMLLEAGYNSSFTLGLIINSSDIAFLIPPSIGFIVYGVATSTSIGMLFLAGIFPGLMILVMFSIYCYAYSKVKKIPTLPKASWAERISAVKDGLPVLGFPVIIVGGIYAGIFSPTEAAAVAVLYALILETIIYKSLTVRTHCRRIFTDRCHYRSGLHSGWRRPGIFIFNRLLADPPAASAAAVRCRSVDAVGDFDHCGRLLCRLYVCRSHRGHIHPQSGFSTVRGGCGGGSHFAGNPGDPAGRHRFGYTAHLAATSSRRS
jgi:TRAP-type uncharacterized transport system fused permease subunit